LPWNWRDGITSGERVQSMFRIKTTKLVYRVLILTLPLLIVSILMTSGVLTWTYYGYFLKNVDQDYRNIIKGSAGEIRFYMEDARKGLEGLAWVVAAIKPDDWQREMALAAFNHSAPQFMSIALLSLEGEEIIATGRVGNKILYAGEDMFKQVLAGKSPISGVMVTKENVPYVHMAVPVYHMGEVRNALWGELNLKSVWDVLEGVNIGDTGQVYIMDLSGRLIGHRDVDRVVNDPLVAGQDVLMRLHEYDDFPQKWFEDRNGVRYLCLGYTIPSLNWIIVLSQEDQEIYSYLYQDIWWAIVTTFFICIGAILIGWNRVKHFLKPIHRLHEQVRKIGEGDLDQKVVVESEDEIGDLGRAFNDMTESLRKFIDREVETAKELVHARNLAILGTTSSKVTHEVGNLLNNIGLALMALRNETLTSKANRIIDILERDADRMKIFTQDFLQFAKKPRLNIEQVALGTTISEIVLIQGPQAEARGIRIELDWPQEPLVVNADVQLIHQVMNNLVKNSLEAMPGPGSIRISGSLDHDRLLICFADTGPGIEAENLERIFDPFFTTKGKKGTGLGLSICKTIVETHHGTIECRSQPGQGTTFILRLPLS